MEQVKKKRKDIETIRYSPFLLEGKEMIDMRYWRWTRNGPKPTAQKIMFERSYLPLLIVGMQRLFRNLSSEEARQKEAQVNG